MDTEAIKELLAVLAPIYVMHRTKGADEKESLRMAQKEAKLIIEAVLRLRDRAGLQDDEDSQ